MKMSLLHTSALLVIFLSQVCQLATQALDFDESSILHGRLSKEGFHRVLRYSGRITLLPHHENKMAIESCYFMLQQNIPRNLYIDLDEAKNKEQFGGPKVIAEDTFNTEKASFESESENAFLYPAKVLHNKNTLAFNISLNVHVRYQMPTLNGSNEKVELQSPSIYMSCDNHLTRGDDKIEAPCNSRWKDLCHWILTKNIKKDLNGFILQVPTGDKSKTLLVTVLTCSTSLISSFLIISNLFWL